jgi:hypothetical protein
LNEGNSLIRVAFFSFRATAKSSLSPSRAVNRSRLPVPSHLKSTCVPLDLRGKIVTGDAMFAHREISLQVVETGGDYVWTTKDNQATLR